MQDKLFAEMYSGCRAPFSPALLLNALWDNCYQLKSTDMQVSWLQQRMHAALAWQNLVWTISLQRATLLTVFAGVCLGWDWCVREADTCKVLCYRAVKLVYPTL